jgi:hypothetical protein
MKSKAQRQFDISFDTKHTHSYTVKATTIAKAKKKAFKLLKQDSCRLSDWDINVDEI